MRRRRHDIEAPARRPLARRIAAAAFALVALAGIATLAALAASEWHARVVAEESITEMAAKSALLDTEQRAEVEAQAHAYNAALAARALGTDSEDPPDPGGIWPYERQLLYDREPMMSYIEIPAIGARLPIYHGTSEAALMAGVGHYDRSSLPIGGSSSHCVLMGHTGMHGVEMFDRLVELVAGDVLVIWTLSEPYAYRVSASEVVEPEEVDSLAPVAGRDLVTLVTCTPYGVNTHRLLVHAERCGYDADEAEMPPPAPTARGWALAIAIAAAVAVALALAVAAAIGGRRASAARGRN